MHIDISDIADDFPEFRVAVLVVGPVTVTGARPAALAQWLDEQVAAARRRWDGAELADIPGIAVWRRAYRAFGVKRTSYRSSVERLMKNALAGRALPAINAFVDVYNGASLAHVLPAGADDLDNVVGDIAFRRARPGDSFVDMAAEGNDPHAPPKAGEVVYADDAKVLCRRWNWRQDARSLVTPDTRRAVVTIQSNGSGDVVVAADDLAQLLSAHCEARCHITLCDASRPRVALAGAG